MSFWRSAGIFGILAVVAWYLLALFQPKLPIHVDGVVAQGFEGVKDVFIQNFHDEVEPRQSGSAYSVYHKGQKVVDLWGGYADVHYARVWKENTTAMFYSCTKTVAMVCILRLVDNGLLDLDQKVAYYWPEFGQNGKENITLRLLFSHQAGLAVLNESVTFDVLTDIDEVARILEISPPLWTPGTDRAYHALSFGLYCAHLLRRVDPKHRSLAQFFQEEIAQPFDIDFGTNVPYEEYYRLARIERIGSSMLMEVLTNVWIDPYFFKMLAKLMDPTSLISRALSQWGDIAVHHLYANPDRAVLEFPSGLGAGTARGMAKLFGILANSGVDASGKRLLSDEMVKEMGTVHTNGTCALLGIPVRFGMGTWIFDVDGHNIFGHPGAGGQVVFSDPVYQLGHAYVSRLLSPYGMGNDPRYLALRDATYRSIKKLRAQGD